MTKTKTYQVIETVKEFAAATVLFCMWVAAILYLNENGYNMAGLLFYTGLAFLTSSLICSIMRIYKKHRG